jgi:protein-tyrosine phosphatase
MPPGPRLYRIAEPFGRRLAVSSRPHGWTDLEDQVAWWKKSGVDVVVSMMEYEEAEELGLGRQEEECADAGIELIRCPVPDHGIPTDRDALLDAVDRAVAHLEAGRSVVAHCFAGIGRSPLFVASVLVRQGLAADIAWERITAARGHPLPDTDDQWQWVADLADHLAAQQE